jgi:hypothetical protein
MRATQPACRLSSRRNWRRSSTRRRRGNEWLHEIKYDGYRAIAAVAAEARRSTPATVSIGPIDLNLWLNRS